MLGNFCDEILEGVSICRAHTPTPDCWHAGVNRSADYIDGGDEMHSPWINRHRTGIDTWGLKVSLCTDGMQRASQYTWRDRRHSSSKKIHTTHTKACTQIIKNEQERVPNGIIHLLTSCSVAMCGKVRYLKAQSSTNTLCYIASSILSTLSWKRLPCSESIRKKTAGKPIGAYTVYHFP